MNTKLDPHVVKDARAMLLKAARILEYIGANPEMNQASIARYESEAVANIHAALARIER